MGENIGFELNAREKFWMSQKPAFVSIRIAAEKTRRHTATVHRAIANNELEVKLDGKQKFVSIRSLIDWIGKDTAKAYGLLPASTGEAK